MSEGNFSTGQIKSKDGEGTEDSGEDLLFKQNDWVVGNINDNAGILREGGMDHETNFNIRPAAIDFQWIDSMVTEDDFLDWTARETGVPRSILEDENSPESKEIYRDLNIAYQGAKNFLLGTLRYDIKEIQVTEPGKLLSKQDLFKLLKNIKLAKGKTEGLSQSRKYCRIVRTTLATYEAKKHDALLLKKITEAFEGFLISDDGKDTPLVRIGKTEDGIFKFLTQDGAIDGIFDSRAKEFEGVVLRFLTRPESNAEVALGDGVGVQIVIEKEQAIALAPVLYEWLVLKMGIKGINIQNQSLLSGEEKEKLTEDLIKTGERIKVEIERKQEERKNSRDSSEFFNEDVFVPEDGFSLSDDKPNSTSSGDLKVLKIKGRIKFTEDEIFSNIASKPISMHSGQFEILLLPKERNDKEGKNHHDVYDAKKLIMARTRLDGSCNEAAFNEFVKHASESRISEADIKYFLLGEDDSPIIEMEKNGKLVYLTFSVYERWKELGFVSNSLFKQIEEARIKTREKYGRKEK